MGETDFNKSSHSVKVQKIMEEIPKSLVRWGFLIITVIFIALILAIIMVPYTFPHGESILYHVVGFFK